MRRCSLTVSLSKCWLSDLENSQHANASDPQESTHRTSASQMPCGFIRSCNMRKMTTGCHKNLAHLLLKTNLYAIVVHLNMFRVKAWLGELINWSSESSMPHEHNRKQRWTLRYSEKRQRWTCISHYYWYIYIYYIDAYCPEIWKRAFACWRRNRVLQQAKLTTLTKALDCLVPFDLIDLDW